MPRAIPARTLFFTAIAFSFAAFSQPGLAKCQTDRIDVSGEGLGNVVSISEPQITSEFFVYNGPGVSVNGQQVHMDPDNQTGNFIYWPAGAVDDFSTDGDTFAVSFFCTYNNGKPEKIYEIDYHFRMGEKGGYILLPGAADSRYYRNVSTIIHDVEGNWFRSTEAWERTIRPIIEQAIQKHAATLAENAADARRQ